MMVDPRTILKFSCAMFLAVQGFAAEDSAATNAVSNVVESTVTKGSANAVTNAVTNAARTTGVTLESFAIISRRNIFNQNRSPQAARRPVTERRVEPVVQAISLVGTISYEKGDFAFFDGTKAEYRKPAKAGEKIGGYEVKEITPSSVTIANEGQEFELKVGQQIRREDEGEWQLSTSGSRLTMGGSKTEPGESNASESGASAGGGAEEEALRRLMEKRAKEINE